MFISIILVVIVLIIILLPIPFKITLRYSKKTLEVFVYNKKIKTKAISNSDVKNFPTINIFKSIEFKDLKPIIYRVKNLKLKFTISLNLKLEYGFDDAAFVAILFGLIHSSYSLLYSLSSNFIKVKNMTLNVTPHYEKSDLKMETMGIIYMNLVKVIYMAFVVLICLIKIKNKKQIKKYKGEIYNGKSSN